MPGIKADKLDLATAEKLREAQVDVAGAAVIDVQTDEFMGKRRLWVSVNGICVFRAQGIELLRMIDLTKAQPTITNLYDLAPKIDLNKGPTK